MIVGAALAGPKNRALAYVVFGKASAFRAAIRLSRLNGTNGFQLVGPKRGGVSVAGAGDVNGDGFSDVIIGIPSTGSFVVFGRASGFPDRLKLLSLDGTNGFRLTGEQGEDSGRSVASAGDVNGDGFSDLIIGAPYGTSDGTPNVAFAPGKSYIVFGKSSGFPPVLDLSSLDGENGFRVLGDGGPLHSGWSVASAGDVNGDGFSDIIAGGVGECCDGIGYADGGGYVVFGKGSPFPDLIDTGSLDGTNGFRMSGGGYGGFGYSVAGAGDINKDGFSDVVFGDPYGSKSAYVVFGKASGFPPVMDLNLDGTNGFRLVGGLTTRTGTSVAGAGDINCDGFPDVMVSAPYTWTGGFAYYAGSTYVVFGKTAGFPAAIDLSSLDGTNGFRLDGVRYEDYSGYSVAGAGDVNGDGCSDVVIGAPAVGVPAYDNPYYSPGTAYVVFGHP